MNAIDTQHAPARSPVPVRTEPRMHRLAMTCLLALLGLASLGLGLGVSRVGQAANTSGGTILVTTSSDTVADDGLCSLREAVTAANSDSPFHDCPAGSLTDTVALPAGVFTLTLSGKNDHTNASGDIEIFTSLVLQGAGPVQTVIQAGPGFDSGLLHVANRGAGADPAVTIQGLTLRDATHIAALWVGNKTTVTASNVHVTGASGDASGIYSQGDVTLLNSAVFSNTGGFNGMGAGFNHTGVSATIVGSRIEWNEATSGGGVNAFGGRLVIKDSTISQNSATSGGGVSGSGEVAIENSVIAYNHATGSDPLQLPGGGGVQVLGSLVMSDSQVLSNTAALYGGGVYALGKSRLANSRIQGNHADIGGGIGNAGQMTLDNSQVLDNQARRGAGIGNAGALTMEKGRIAGNQAGQIGGGIGNDGGTNFVLPLIGHAIITGTVIENNRAERGAGIGTGGVFTLTNAMVRGNVASFRGGGIAVGNGELTVTGGDIKDNQAGIGGGIHHTFETQYGVRPSHATLQDVTIQGNRAITEGGGLAAAGGAITLTQSSMFLNQAPVAAGVLAGSGGEDGPGTLILEGTQLASSSGENCSATEGGQIISNGNNASSDASCKPFLDENGDQNEVDIPLPGQNATIYLPTVLR